LFLAIVIEDPLVAAIVEQPEESNSLGRPLWWLLSSQQTSPFSLCVSTDPPSLPETHPVNPVNPVHTQQTVLAVDKEVEMWYPIAESLEHLWGRELRLRPRRCNA